MQTVLLFREASGDAGLSASLVSLGYTVVAQLDEPAALRREVTRLEPNVIVVTTQSPSAGTLDTLSVIAETCARPVVMFARDGSREVIRKAVECGVEAYVVDGLEPARIRPIIEAACARFEASESVRRELETTRAKLAERKLIEKAKGIVMQQRRLSEDEAYGALRKMAMDQNLALAEVARRVISVAQLLG